MHSCSMIIPSYFSISCQPRIHAPSENEGSIPSTAPENHQCLSMEGSRRKGVLAVVSSLLIILVGVSGRKPVLHRVGGGRNTWAPDVNFTQWASHEVFYVGDWLYFGFDKHRYNVLQVNKTSFDTCTDKDFIANITRGGRDVFNLTQAKPYYFLSGGGYCYNGMKLAIDVKDPPLADPTRPPPHILPRVQSSANSTKLDKLVLGIATFMALVFHFMH